MGVGIDLRAMRLTLRGSKATMKYERTFTDDGGGWVVGNELPCW